MLLLAVGFLQAVLGVGAAQRSHFRLPRVRSCLPGLLVLVEVAPPFDARG